MEEFGWVGVDRGGFVEVVFLRLFKEEDASAGGDVGDVRDDAFKLAVEFLQVGLCG